MRCAGKWFVCSLALVVVHMNALQFGTPTINTFEKTSPETGNVTRWESRTLPFTATELDFEALDVQIGDLFYDFVCLPPDVLIETTLEGFTTFKRRLFINDVCTLENSKQLNTSAVPADMPIPDNSIHRRRLLQLPPVGFSGSSLLFAGWAGAGLGSVISGQSPICGMTFGLVGCKTSDSGPQPNAAEVQMLQSLNTWADNQLTWDQTDYQGLTQQQKINLGFKAVLDNNQQQLDTLGKSVSTLAHTDAILAQTIDSNQQATAAEFKQVYSDLLHGITANQQYTDANVAKLQAAMLLNFQRVINTTNAIGKNVTDNARLSVQRERRLGRLVRTLTGAVYRDRLRVDTRRQQSLGTWAQIDEATAMGLDIYAHPDSPGVRPTPYAQLLQFDKEVIIDDMYISWINKSSPSSSVLIAHQLQLGWRGAASGILDNEGIDANWEDLLDILGPKGCIANATAHHGLIVDYCNAWIEITHVQCTPINGFHWDSISSNQATRQNRAAYKLGPSICANNGQPTAGTACVGASCGASAWNSRKVDSTQEWMTLLQPTCATQLAVDLVHPHKFQLYSSRAGVSNLPQPTNPLVCSFDVNTLFESSDFVLTLPFTIYQDLRLSYASFLIDKLPYEELRYGIMPNWVTHVEKPFLYASDGRFYNCWRSHFIAQAPEVVPFSSTRFLDIIPQCTTTAFNRPRICTGPSCPAHRVQVSSDISNDITATLNKGLEIPDGKVIYGEWTGTGMTEIIDADEDLSSLSENGRVRENKITHQWIAVPTGFNYATAVSYPPRDNLKIWFNRYGPDFDHRGSAVSPDILVRDVAGDSRCVQLGTQRFGWACKTLDSFIVSSRTNMRTGQLILNPRQFRYSGSSQITLGEIIQRVQDGCPDFKYTVYTDRTVDFVITNSLPFDVKCVLRRTGSLPGCSHLGDLALTVPAKQQFTENVLPCGNFTVQLFAVGVNNVLTPCLQKPQQVTVNPNAVTSINKLALGGFNTTFISDAVGAGLISLSDQLLTFVNSFVPLISIIVDVHLTPAEKSAAANATLQSVLADIRNQQIDLAALTSNSAVSNIAADQAALIAFMTTFNALVIANKKQLNLTAADINALNATLGVLQKLTNQQAANTVDLDKKIAADITALQNQANSNSDCSSSVFSGWNLDCGIGYLITKVLTLGAYCVLVGALGWIAVKVVYPLCKGVLKSDTAYVPVDVAGHVQMQTGQKHTRTKKQRVNESSSA